MTAARRGERGVTLVELLITVAVAGIAVSMLSTTMYYQQKNYAKQLQYLEAQQNARASISLLKRYVRTAGWGTIPGEATSGGGSDERVFSIGTCVKCNDLTSPGSCTDMRYEKACDQKDEGGGKLADRLRVLYMDPGTNQGYVPRHGDNQTTTDDLITVKDGIGGHPLANGTHVLVSGDCTGGATANTLSFLTVDVSSCGVPCVYDVVANIEGGGKHSCGAAGGLHTTGEFTMGKAQLADFYIDRQDTSHPELRMRLGPTTPLTSAFTIAYDIDTLQVEYGLDLDAPMDGVVDLWCHQPDKLDANCLTGMARWEDNMIRIIAVKLAIVARTRDYRDDLAGTTTNRDVFNYNMPFAGDGYRRWVYRATIQLRNNEPK